MSFYRTLLSVEVKHSYNSSSICPSLIFTPTEKTCRIFRKAGLMFRASADGIQIIYEQDRLEALEMCATDPQEPLSFDFKVTSNDPCFRSYTEPYGDSRNEILYFSNRLLNGSGTQVLSTSRFVSAQDIRQSDSSELSDLMNQKDQLIPPEFIVRIFADNSQGSSLKSWLEQSPTIYSIRFNSKKRYWKYYLLGKIASNSTAQNSLTIIDPDKKVEFESTGQEILSNKRLAYTFRSKQQIPIYEHYSYRFQLRQKGEAGESTVMSSLPSASVKQIGKDSIAEKEVIVSEIYINS